MTPYGTEQRFPNMPIADMTAQITQVCRSGRLVS